MDCLATKEAKKIMNRQRMVGVAVLALFFSITTATNSSSAAYCPPPDAKSKTVGKIKVDNIVVEVKNVDYPKGKSLLPPKSPLVAGVSIRHRPLSADFGSSLVVWHVSYNGCQGKLNPIINKKKGYSFQVVDEKGRKTEYAISQRIQVKRGKYDPKWFMLSGPRQLVLVTCTNRVGNRGFLDNLFIIASPVING